MRNGRLENPPKRLRYEAHSFTEADYLREALKQEGYRVAIKDLPEGRFMVFAVQPIAPALFHRGQGFVVGKSKDTHLDIGGSDA